MLRDDVKDERDEDGVKPYVVETELATAKRALAAVLNFIDSINCLCSVFDSYQ